MMSRERGVLVKLSEMELKALIQGGETNTVELKVAAPRATEMAELLCGMANAQGGVVIIGVKDSSHEIVGVPDKRLGETLDVVLRAVRQMIKPELVLDPSKPEIYTLEGKKLVVAMVKPSHGPVYQAHGIYWVRRGTHTVSLGLSELLEMANDRGLVDWEHQPVRNATIEDLDLEKVKAYLTRRSTSDRQASRFKDLERVLIGMECAVRTHDGKVVPTNAGLLFFGYAPQEHIIQSDVACVLYRETLGASRYADRRFVTGTLQDLIDGAELFLSRYIAVGARVEGFKRIDIKDIPGYMERLGSGIRFMLDETRRLGLPWPQFREMGEFIVTFQKAPALMSPRPQPQYAGTLWGDEEGSRPEILSQEQSDQRERRLTKAVEYVQKYGFITNSIYRQLTGVSDRTAHRDLETLIERGRLKGTGQRAARRYVLA